MRQGLNPDKMGIGGVAGDRTSPVQDDLTFELKTAPGRIRLLRPPRPSDRAPQRPVSLNRLIRRTYPLREEARSKG
jgi:hypothetical protein